MSALADQELVGLEISIESAEFDYVLTNSSLFHPASVVYPFEYTYLVLAPYVYEVPHDLVPPPQLRYAPQIIRKLLGSEDKDICETTMSALLTIARLRRRASGTCFIRYRSRCPCQRTTHHL